MTKFETLIGYASEFSLESRIFHSISVGLILLSAVYVPYNLYAGLYVGSLSALIIGLIYVQQFYYSRFYNKKHSNIVFGVTGILVFGVNYFTNSGINGSTDLIWPAYLLLVLAISPSHQHLKWLVAYMLVFFILHIIEYYFPFLVQHPFNAGKGQFVDRITAFPMPVAAIYICIRFVKRSYDREKQAAEEKTLAVEKLMSIISHDLRTPLINVQNYLELLNEGELETADRVALEKALLHSTDNAMDMLSNLLHWSKSQMEGPTVNIRRANLMETLSATLEIERIHALKKNISLESDISADLHVLADVDMLQLVIRNLISNAVKFTSQDGMINVIANSANGECQIMVQDNGKGIPLDKQDKVFSIKAEPSYGTNNEKGVGLGLVLCKEFIDRQGGRIEFESKPEEGTVFSIFLPLA